MAILLYVILGVLLILFVVGIITRLSKYYQKKLNTINQVFLKKLSDNKKDDITKAVAHLELTNSIK